MNLNTFFMHSIITSHHFYYKFLIKAKYHGSFYRLVGCLSGEYYGYLYNTIPI